MRSLHCTTTLFSNTAHDFGASRHFQITHFPCLSAETNSPFGDDQFTEEIEQGFPSVFGFKLNTMLPEGKDKGLNRMT